MLIVILVICIGMLILGGYIHNNLRMEGTGMTLSMCFGIVGIITAIAIIVGIGSIAGSGVLPEKIEMYQSENAIIQNEISAAVESYKEFESETFKGIKSQSPITLVTMFPELKSNELVAKQIEVYIENNAKIKELKESQINASVWKWWVYFGG